MNQKIRVGLVGAHVGRGWGMMTHVPALQNLPEYELVAVCTAHGSTGLPAVGRLTMSGLISG